MKKLGISTIAVGAVIFLAGLTDILIKITPFVSYADSRILMVIGTALAITGIIIFAADIALQKKS